MVSWLNCCVAFCSISRESLVQLWVLLSSASSSVTIDIMCYNPGWCASLGTLDLTSFWLDDIFYSKSLSKCKEVVQNKFWFLINPYNVCIIGWLLWCSDRLNHLPTVTQKVVESEPSLFPKSCDLKILRRWNCLAQFQLHYLFCTSLFNWQHL